MEVHILYRHPMDPALRLRQQTECPQGQSPGVLSQGGPPNQLAYLLPISSVGVSVPMIVLMRVFLAVLVVMVGMIIMATITIGPLRKLAFGFYIDLR